MQSRAPLISLSVSLCLLASVAAYRAALQSAPAEAIQYHQRVLALAEADPEWIGSWQGRSVDVMEGAVKMLHPNVFISKRYSNSQTGNVVNLLIVQCHDARDLLGHYPPVCYVAHGWTKGPEREKVWLVAGSAIRGKEYEYSRLVNDQMVHVFVCDFMLLPDGTTSPDMDMLKTHAQGYRQRYFGAAQVQAQFDAGVSADDRKTIFETLLGGHKALLDQIGSEGKP